METHSINIPASLQKFFSVVPENAVLFGGAIRDLARGDDKVNNLDLLFKNEDDINKFYTDIVFKIDKNSNINSINEFEGYDDISPNDIDVNIKKIKLAVEGNEYQINCFLSKNPTGGFISDYDVNSLYGVVKDNKVEIINTIIKFTINDSFKDIIYEIKKSNSAVGHFNKNTSQRIIDWRKSKIEKHGFFANFNNPEENDSKFVSANEILAQASEFFKNKMNKKEQEILDKNDPESSYNYCLDNKEANISLHEDIVCKSNKALYIYAFARDVKEANINKLEEAIIKTNNAFYIYYFAKDIKNANLDKFKDILENSEYKEKFAELYSKYKTNSSSNFDEPKETLKINEQAKTARESKKESKMANNGFDAEFFTKNLAEGAYAGAANEVVNNLAKSLILAIKASGMDEGSVKIIEEGMNSQLGKICLAIMVGTGIKFIPVNLLQENKSLQKIAEKCVENAGSQGTQFALNGATNILLPALLGAIQDNPQLKLAEQVGALTAPTKARVESNVKDLADDLSEEEANAFNEEFAKKKAKSGLNK